MKKIIYLLFALPLFIASCSSDEVAISEETVEVTFRAAVPCDMPTRAGVADLNVDKVVCVVYEGNDEVTTMREVKSIAADGSISFSPRLIRGHAYDVVFWAMKEGAYNVTNMQAITRNPGLDEVYYDAFTATTQIVVESSHSTQNITLSRPLAKLNLGVTPDDWNGVADANTFGMTPTTITLKVEGKETFNALIGMATGSSTTLTYNLTVSGEVFTCEGNDYKNIAMCYVPAEAAKGVTNLTFSLYDQDGDAIRQDAPIINVPLQRNYVTHVVGGLLTGVITYQIAFENNGEYDGEHPYEI